MKTNAAQTSIEAYHSLPVADYLMPQSLGFFRAGECFDQRGKDKKGSVGVPVCRAGRKLFLSQGNNLAGGHVAFDTGTFPKTHQIGCAFDVGVKIGSQNEILHLFRSKLTSYRLRALVAFNPIYQVVSTDKGCLSLSRRAHQLPKSQQCVDEYFFHDFLPPFASSKAKEYTNSVTSKKGVIGIGVPDESTAKSRTPASRAAFLFGHHVLVVKTRSRKARQLPLRGFTGTPTRLDCRPDWRPIGSRYSTEPSSEANMAATSSRVRANKTIHTSSDSSAVANGLVAFRRLLKTIQRCNSKSVALNGDVDVAAVALHLKSALDCADAQRDGLLLGLADFLASAMDGVVIDPDYWTPPKLHCSDATGERPGLPL